MADPKNHIAAAGLSGFVLGSLLTWFFYSNSSAISPLKLAGLNKSREKSETSMMMGADIDAHFIEQMIPHHEDAIVMAKLALEKSKRPEILELSNSIIESQGEEIEQMKVWYLDWYGKEVPQGSAQMREHGMMGQGGMHMGMMGNEADLESLENAQNFDADFISLMIPHHQMAFMMASMLASSTERPEMKELATNIIAAQNKEIEEMRTWYTDWGY